MREFIITAIVLLIAGALAGVVAGYVVNQDAQLGAPLNWVQETNPTFITYPTDGAATDASSGTLWDNTSYYFRLSAVDYAGGETIASPEFYCTTDDNTGVATSSCAVTYTAVSGAASYKLWTATTSDTYYAYFSTTTQSALIATTSGGGMTLGTMKQTGTAYAFNSGVDMDNTFLKSYATASKLVKTGQTFVHTITYSPTDAVPQAASIEILDNTTLGSGTSTAFFTTAAAMQPVTITLDQIFTTGLYVYMSGTTDVNVSVSYK